MFLLSRTAALEETIYLESEVMNLISDIISFLFLRPSPHSVYRAPLKGSKIAFSCLQQVAERNFFTSNSPNLAGTFYPVRP